MTAHETGAGAVMAAIMSVVKAGGKPLKLVFKDRLLTATSLDL